MATKSGNELFQELIDATKESKAENRAILEQLTAANERLGRIHGLVRAAVILVILGLILYGVISFFAAPKVTADLGVRRSSSVSGAKTIQVKARDPSWDDPKIKLAVRDGLRYRDKLAGLALNDHQREPGWWENLPKDQRVALLTVAMPLGLREMTGHYRAIWWFPDMVEVMRNEIRNVALERLADDFESLKPYLVTDPDSQDRDPKDSRFQLGKAEEGEKLMAQLDEARKPIRGDIENAIGSYFYLLREEGPK